MVYVFVKEDPNEERYEEGKALISHISKNDTWIIDSGSSCRMTDDINKFEKIEECDGETIKIGNDIPCRVKGRGSLMLNDKIRCENAYWVQGLKYNVLSVVQLNNIGHKVEF